MTKGKLSLLVVLAALVTGCKSSAIEQTVTEEKADLVLVNGEIYTVESAQPWVEAVAIKDGAYLYAGDANGARQYQGKYTQVIDLKGKMAMPGINDAHQHPEMGGLKMLYQCVFPFTATPDEIVATVARCVKDNPEAEWIIGGQWDSDLFVKHPVDSPKALLDLVSGDKAVLLSTDSGHDGWANSKALQLAGITKDSPKVEGGVIVRNPETGEPNGLLLENANELVEKHGPDW